MELVSIKDKGLTRVDIQHFVTQPTLLDEFIGRKREQVLRQLLAATHIKYLEDSCLSHLSVIQSEGSLFHCRLLLIWETECKAEQWMFSLVVDFPSLEC
ncbi:MAG: hypothetical protein JO011_22360 [Ktedonobacteraceae bacterium]|nr:hypothetical protein [Ktedonobacteraceae bacterium]MBV9713651.1 hypothetical protein [Ktedonobacteraceae bacterium]